VLFFSQFAAGTPVFSVNNLSGASCNFSFPLGGRDLPPENPDFQLEFEIFPGKKTFSNWFQKFSPGKKRFPIGFRNFPREKSVFQLAFEIFPGKKGFSNWFQKFSPGKKRFPIGFRNFPREKNIFQLASKIFPGKIRIAGSLPDHAPGFRRLRSGLGWMRLCPGRLPSESGDEITAVIGMIRASSALLSFCSSPRCSFAPAAALWREPAQPAAVSCPRFRRPTHLPVRVSQEAAKRKAAAAEGAPTAGRAP
jgi:hypothetical protein